MEPVKPPPLFPPTSFKPPGPPTDEQKEKEENCELIILNKMPAQLRNWEEEEEDEEGDVEMENIPEGEIFEECERERSEGSEEEEEDRSDEELDKDGDYVKIYNLSSSSAGSS
jgi:hypothetical protein